MPLNILYALNYRIPKGISEDRRRLHISERRDNGAQSVCARESVGGCLARDGERSTRDAFLSYVRAVPWPNMMTDEAAELVYERMGTSLKQQTA